MLTATELFSLSRHTDIRLEIESERNLHALASQQPQSVSSTALNCQPSLFKTQTVCSAAVCQLNGNLSAQLNFNLSTQMSAYMQFVSSAATCQLSCQLSCNSSTQLSGLLTTQAFPLSDASLSRQQAFGIPCAKALADCILCCSRNWILQMTPVLLCHET